MRDQLTVARVRKENDNTKVSPVDLLQTIIADIQDGKIKADGLIVAIVNRPEGEAWELTGYRCAVTRCEEVALLELAKEVVIRKWRSA